MQLAWLHQPMASTWMTRFQRYYEGVIGGQLPGAPVSYYGVAYTLSPALHIANYAATDIYGGNQGPGMNGTDASDFGVGVTSGIVNGIATGGQIVNDQLHDNAGRSLAEYRRLDRGRAWTVGSAGRPIGLRLVHDPRAGRQQWLLSHLLFAVPVGACGRRDLPDARRRLSPALLSGGVPDHQ